MHYEFPHIAHIDDVLPHIDDTCFRIITKEGMTFVSYKLDGLDTFPIVEGTAQERLRAAVRRECRGITFDAASGRIISRPLHKFFNIGQRPDCQPQDLDISRPHILLEKLDGSMIRPLPFADSLRWGTKMGITDVGMLAETFIIEDAFAFGIKRYEELAWECVNDGFTPIFEFCSRANRIVLDYPEPKLVLTAIRHTVKGVYISYEGLVVTGKKFWNIPVVVADTIKSISDMEGYLSDLKRERDIEGSVVRWDDGSMAKGKTDWYVRIHRAKDMMRSERRLLDLWFENELDDLLPALFTEDRERISAYINRFTRELWASGDRIKDLYDYVRDQYETKKDFAISTAGTMPHADRCMMFALWDNKFPNGIVLADNMVKRSLSSTEKFDDTLSNLGMNTKWEEVACQT